MAQYGDIKEQKVKSTVVSSFKTDKLNMEIPSFYLSHMTTFKKKLSRLIDNSYEVIVIDDQSSDR